LLVAGIEVNFPECLSGEGQPIQAVFERFDFIGKSVGFVCSFLGLLIGLRDFALLVNVEEKVHDFSRFSAQAWPRAPRL
jgi:hypothetical protein